MDFKQLEAFAAVVNLGSFSRRGQAVFNAADHQRAISARWNGNLACS